MKKILLSLMLMSYIGVASAQLEISSFSATGGGYSTTWLNGYQALGVNPANLGWVHEKYSMSLGLNEIALSVYTEPLTRDQVINDLFNSNTKFNNEEKKKAAKEFTDKRMWGQGGDTWFGFSFNAPKVGGFAFSIRDRGLWSTKFNYNASNFLFLGYRDPYFDSIKVNSNGDTTGYRKNPGWTDTVYAGSDAKFLWYREYNFGYGREIINTTDVKLYGGIGLKYISGYGSFMYDYLHKNTSYSALSSVFDVRFDEPTPSIDTSKGLKRNGTGYGIDLGFTFVYKKITAAFAVNDFGNIVWDGNVYNGEKSTVWKIKTAGINNYNIFAEGDLIKSDKRPGDPEQWVGISSKTVPLPMHMRFGASYQIKANLEAGFDALLPMKKNVPGNYVNPLFAIGSRYKPAKWVMLSLGAVTGSEFDFAVPFGISFFPNNNEDLRWEIGFAMRDVSSFVKQKNPTVSFAFGFLRFEFGKMKVPVEDPNKSKF